MRRSNLWVPGARPKMMQKATTVNADVIVLDLEDSVAPSEKEAARSLVVSALQDLDFRGKERAVRVNEWDSEWGFDDICAITKARVDSLVIPKVRTPEQIVTIDGIVGQIERKEKIPLGSTKLQLTVETAEGIMHVDKIAFSSKRITALWPGTLDIARETGAQLVDEEAFIHALSYCFGRVLIAATAAKVDKLWGGVPGGFGGIKDLEGLKRIAMIGRRIGYDGMIVIHPDHIEVVNQIFSPSKEEVQKARSIVAAYEDALKKGISYFAIDGGVVGPPTAERARKVVELAKKLGM